MLNAPFFVSFRKISSFVHDLIIGLTAHIDQICNKFGEFIFIFNELIDRNFFSLYFIHFVSVYSLFYHFGKVRLCSFDEILDKVEQEIKSVDIDFFKADF